MGENAKTQEYNLLAMTENIKLPKDYLDCAVEFLVKKGFRKRDIQNAYASFTNGKTFVNIYNSGSLVIQGKDTQSLKEEILSLVKLEGIVAGCDESGKGDVFGPLVLCCCAIKPENFRKVLEIAPKDSKKIEDERLFKKVPILENYAEFYCISLEPEELNKLYQEKQNINRILDWGYKKLLEDVLAKHPKAKITIAAYYHRNPFGSLVNFEPKAEEKVEVACASMKARYEFLKWLKAHNLPKGSSPQAMDMARRMAKTKKDCQKYLKIFFLNPNLSKLS